MHAKRIVARAVLASGFARQALALALMSSSSCAETASSSTTALTAGIKRELDAFTHSVGSLNDGLSSMGARWSDQQYSTLLALVRTLADTSRKVVLSGGRACTMLDRFERIAQENT